MFTGIIQGVAQISAIVPGEQFVSIACQIPQEWLGGLVVGASVSVSGVCLTVVNWEGSEVWFDVMSETLRKTTLGSWKVGTVVNIERSARIGDEIGGHLMSGHVSTLATIVEINETPQNKDVVFRVDPEWMKFVFSKGFIGLDGASLTIVDADAVAGTFHVWFIPETLKKTTFGIKHVGDRVHVEIDPHTQAVVETVERVLTHR